MSFRNRSGMFGYDAVTECPLSSDEKVGVAYQRDGEMMRAPVSMFDALKAAANGTKPTDEQRDKLNVIGVEMIDVTEEMKRRDVQALLDTGMAPAEVKARIDTYGSMYRASKSIKLITAFKNAN